MRRCNIPIRSSNEFATLSFILLASGPRKPFPYCIRTLGTLSQFSIGDNKQHVRLHWGPKCSTVAVVLHNRDHLSPSCCQLEHILHCKQRSRKNTKAARSDQSDSKGRFEECSTTRYGLCSTLMIVTSLPAP